MINPNTRRIYLFHKNTVNYCLTLKIIPLKCKNETAKFIVRSFDVWVDTVAKYMENNNKLILFVSCFFVAKY